MIPVRSDSGAAPGAARTTTLRTLLVERLTHGELELPLLPATASQVLQVCNEQSADARKLAELIQLDPALAAHVLRVANSAAYCPSEPIVSLQQAVARLGFAAMCGIALAIAMQGKVFAVPGQEVRVRQLWSHSVLAGGWARELARARRKNVEAAFQCGLLHDVGKPVVLQAALLIAKARAVLPTRDELEGLLTTLHAQVGQTLLQSWKLPAWMVSAVAHHHQPEHADAHVDEARLAHLADELAHWTVAPDEPRTRALLANASASALGFYADDVAALLAKRDAVLELAKAYA
jgi:putative nucleotidyltransferase with HDIG domain